MGTADTYATAVTSVEVAWVHRQLRRLGVPAEDLEDAVQDVLLHTFRRWADFDRNRSLRAWMFGFAFRVASDHRRRARRHDRPSDGASPDELEHDLGRSPEEALAAQRARALVTSALDSLPLERRAIVVLVDLEGFSVPEASASLEVGLNTAYSRLRVGRNELVDAVRRLSRGEVP